MSTKFLFFVTLFFTLLFSFFLGITNRLLLIIVGGYLSLLYLLILSLVFFFKGETPRLRRRLLEAAAVFALSVAAFVYPPLTLVMIPAALFVVFAPIALGLRAGVFRGIIHAVAWYFTTAGISTAVYAALAILGVKPPVNPYTLALLVVVPSALVSHYLLLRVFQRG